MHQRSVFQRWAPWVLAAMIIAGVVLSIVLQQNAYQAGSQADASDVTLVAEGKHVYIKHCARCHGLELEGQPDWRTRQANGRLPAPPHDENGHSWHHPDQMLFEVSKFGLVPPHAPAGYQSDMPAFKNSLTDAQIWAVLAYIKSRWPAQARQVQAEIDAEFRKQGS